MKAKPLKLRSTETTMLRMMWIMGLSVFGLLLAGAAFLAPVKSVLSVAVGGAIALINFRLMQINVQKVLRPGQPGQSMGATLLKYYARFAATAVLIIALMIMGWVEPLGLLAGLSVVVIATLLWTGYQAFKLSKEAV